VLSGLTVNLAPNANLFGNFQVGTFGGFGGGLLDITDDSGTARFHNDGTLQSSGGSVTIDTAVVGVGTIISSATSKLSSRLEFGGFVSDGQTVHVSEGGFSSTVQLDDPRQFHGMMDLHSRIVSGGIGFETTADLIGLPEANSWSYSDGVLSIRGTGGNVIDTLHVVTNLPGLSVSKVGDDILVHPGPDSSGSLTLT
jgi:hypothetical protein